jgi:predicted O-methyltransferase YrrM
MLDRIYATGRVEAEDGTPVTVFPSGVPRAHAEQLAALVRDRDLRRTLETGLGYGISTLAICEVHEARGEGSHIAIDPHQERYRSIGLLNLRRAGLDHRVRVIETRSDEALPLLRAEGVRLDFALIDGRHMLDMALLDFVYIDRMLDVGGIVVFHDTWMPAIAEAVAYVVANRAYEELEAVDHGLAVLRKRGEDDRSWDFHRDFPRGRRWPTVSDGLRNWWTRVRRGY